MAEDKFLYKRTQDLTEKSRKQKKDFSQEEPTSELSGVLKKGERLQAERGGGLTVGRAFQAVQLASPWPSRVHSVSRKTGGKEMHP